MAQFDVWPYPALPLFVAIPDCYSGPHFVMCAFWAQPSAFTGFEITEPSPAHAFLSDFRGYLGLGFFVVFVFVFPVVLHCFYQEVNGTLL